MALSLQRYTVSNANSRFTQLMKERSRKQREKSMLTAIKNVDHLPENLIVEILSWLPVKDLMRYKTINKSWYAIISSPDFVSKHLKNYYKNNDDWRGCLLVQHNVTNTELQVFELFLDEKIGVSLADEVLYSIPLYSSFINGPCDGLYYMYDFFFSYRALWNPTLGELRHLPKIIRKPDLPPTFKYNRYEVYGFGSDPITGDYKVVVIKGYWPTDDSDVKHPPSVFVYSLRTNLWKYCGDLAKAYDLEISKCYIVVSGCCYWLGSYENTSDVIVCFDMATDTFKEIHVPHYAQPSTKCLAVYDDSLAFLCLHDENLNVWTWNEGSWTKTLSVGPFLDVRSPIGHWKDNRLILQCKDGNLVMLDQENNQRLKHIRFTHDMRCDGVYAYMESLVSIKDKKESGQAGEVDSEDKQTEGVKAEDK